MAASASQACRNHRIPPKPFKQNLIAFQALSRRKGGSVRAAIINSGLLICAVVLALAPVSGMRWVLRTHTFNVAEQRLEDTAQRTLTHIDGLLSEAADVIAGVSDIMHASCGSNERSRLSAAAFDARAAKSILILGPDGRTLCSSSEIPAGNYIGLRFRPASQKNLAVALSPVSDAGRSLLNVSFTDGDRMLIASIVLDLQRLDYVPAEWKHNVVGLLAFDDGTMIARLPVWDGKAKTADRRHSAPTLSAVATSEHFPIHVSMNVEMETALDSARILSVIVDLGGGLLGVLFFLIIAQAIWRQPTVEDAIARGIRRDEFIPYYQPVFNIQTGALVGCECLIRWRKADGAIVPPGVFIREAEESGLAVEMTKRLMNKVRDEVGAVYATHPQLKMAINLFADHFSDFATVNDVRHIFSTGGMRYSQLVFEVTERYPLPNLARAKLAIKGLQDLGCKVALDDAGTGHGGLAYLQTLGMDQIKIDKLFIDTITSSNTGSPIIDSLIELGRSLSMEIVAEGIETGEQLHYLRNRGVHFAQGYLFAKPLAGKAYLALIAASSAPPSQAAGSPTLAEGQPPNGSNPAHAEAA